MGVWLLSDISCANSLKLPLESNSRRGRRCWDVGAAEDVGTGADSECSQRGAVCGKAEYDSSIFTTRYHIWAARTCGCVSRP